MPISEQAFDTLREQVNKLRVDVDVKAEVDRNFDRRLDKIETLLSRLTWLIVAGIVSAFVSFMLSGGMAHVTIG